MAQSVLLFLTVWGRIHLREPYTIVKILRGQELLVFELVPTFAFPNEWPASAAAWPEETNDWLSQNEAKISRDLGFYAQALPCPSALGDPSLFRLSFSTTEKYLLRPVALEGNHCQAASSHSLSSPTAGLVAARKASERILRMLRESDKDDFFPVNSYHIKTVLLHECQRWPDLAAWSHEKLGERFLEMLRDLILALDNQELPHFFVRDCNLFRCYAPELLLSAAGRLRAIYQDIVVSPSASIRLQC
ncbi:protein mab-21-like 1 [Plakobranchus ocellatus]|uniref:Protein mab-21-like 1 n=1 Tax=Plakobranchus ocellatus TaxID=259542 RepID=A0AAV4CSV1_9GAST|nr:protein mab-21-like 1 [Plakobranchus ocellatus]